MYNCLNLPLTAAYYFGAPIAGMASVISGYPAPLMVGGKKRKSAKRTKQKRKPTKRSTKVRYSKKLKSSLKKKKSSRRRSN